MRGQTSGTDTRYITGARSVTLGVPNLLACVTFYEKVWGLERVSAAGDTAYFKTTQARHPVLALRPRPSPELLDVALQELSTLTLGLVWQLCSGRPFAKLHFRPCGDTIGL